MNASELLTFFSEDRYIPELKARTKDEALDELAEKFVTTGVIHSKAILLEMLHRRETVGSTGIGHGIAIPHGRTTTASALTLAFGRSTQGIDWDSADGKPAHLIFLVVAPPFEEDNMYLPMLGKLVEILSQKKKRNQLLKITTFEEFKSVLADE